MAKKKTKKRTKRTKDKLHSTVEIPLKTIKVDKKIAVIVQWLNSFEGITTENSCQGDKSPLKIKGSDVPYVKQPYISFLSKMYTDSLVAFDVLQGFGRIDVLVRPGSGHMAYTIRFHTTEERDKLTEWIRSGRVRRVTSGY